MEIFYEDFKNDIQTYTDIKLKCKDLYPDIKFVNNFYLTCDKIANYEWDQVNVVECGVFNGGTLIPVDMFRKHHTDKEVTLTGIDSFRGFPKVNKPNPIDKFDTFTIQHYNGEINNQHYEKARERCSVSADVLSTEYFENVNKNIFRYAKENDVELVKGYFDDVLPTYDKVIDILYLDVDLYDSYLSCLHHLYDNIAFGGCIIFDEYFTYKYPGAKVAIDEFFEDKCGYFERYKTPSDYERWCYVKDAYNHEGR